MSNVFLTGRPTGPDVDSIIAAFPIESISQGDLIHYESIEQIIGEDRKSSRFKSVTDSWRKHLKSYNIVVGCIANTAFEILDPTKRIDESTKGVKSGLRKMKRGAQLASDTPETELSADSKRKRNYTIAVGGAVATLEKTERKLLKYRVPKLAPE